MDDFDVLIIGAGLSGLSCARSLVDAGLKVRVLERSSSVGGRCASKAPGDGPLVDFGPVFVHGDDPEFIAWIESLSAGLIPGWPLVVAGKGTPCQPQAFDPLQKRYGLTSGLRALPQALATGLDINLGVMVESVVWNDNGVEAVDSEGRRFSARHGVMATALEQSRLLMSGLKGPGTEVFARADALLAQFSSLPCLTVLAEYAPEVTPPTWQVAYPENSRALLLASNEGGKRGLDPTHGPLLVFQARPGWSAARLEGDREAWSRELLGEAAALWGDWAGQPTAIRAHRWKYGRLAPSDHLVRPLLLERPGSTARWGLVGDLFDPDGGLQGAWRSGRQLALRLRE